MNVIPCPRCQAQVVVPTGTPDAAVVRCPLCAAEYTLGEALTEAFPQLIIVSLPVAEAAPEETAAADDLFSSANDAATPLEQAATGEPMSLGTRPKPGRPKRSAGGIFQTAGVILGGLMAIPLAQLVLWYLPGNLRRDFGFGPTVAKIPGLGGLVPLEYRGEKTHEEETPAAHEDEPHPPPVKTPPTVETKEEDKKSPSEANGASTEPSSTKTSHVELPAVSRSEPDPTSSTTPPSGNGNSTTNTSASSAPVTPRVTARTPRAAVAQYHVSLLGDDAALAQALHWWPAGERPVVGLRWMVGVTVLGLSSQPTVNDNESLERYTLGLGPKLRQPLDERTQLDAFGRWPESSGEPLNKILLHAGTRAALIESARAQAVDALVQIELDPKVAPGNGAKDFLTKVRLIDVDGAPSGRNVWFSNERLLKEGLLQPKSLPAFVNALLAEVDAKFALQALANVTAAKAQARLEKLEPHSGVPALRTLAEVRYYQTQKLIDAAAAEAAFEKLLGEGKGHAFATGTADQRKTMATEMMKAAK